MPYTVVIADDVTGANDIGIMYAKAGLTALVYSHCHGENLDYAECDVLIVDTDSRFDTAQKAYEKVASALKGISGEDIIQYIDKQCSVFRGNIGAEFDAMLDTLNEEFAAVVLGFPDNGRTTLHSSHYVHGTLLHESQFKNDPVHPMTGSDLVAILQSQTRRTVGAIHYEVYDQGQAALREQLDQARKTCQYCIMDVRDNKDLEFLAGVLKDEKVICGSSALSEYLAKYYTGSGRSQTDGQKGTAGNRILGVAGSLTPQTLNQTAYMKKNGYPVFELDTRKLFDEEAKKKEISRIEALLADAYANGNFAMVHSMNEPGLVNETKIKAAEQGYGNTEVSSLVSAALSEISDQTIKGYGIGNIIVCGGDTSASLCARLNIRGMKVLKEIEAGLPSCQSVDAPFYKMVLKSGSFGSPEFIEKAINILTD